MLLIFVTDWHCSLSWAMEQSEYIQFVCVGPCHWRPEQSQCKPKHGCSHRCFKWKDKSQRNGENTYILLLLIDRQTEADLCWLINCTNLIIELKKYLHLMLIILCLYWNIKKVFWSTQKVYYKIFGLSIHLWLEFTYLNNLLLILFLCF